MEKVKIILESGVEKEVDSIFYLYNSKYYFIYTEKEIDDNGYVLFNLVEVGKEIKNTEKGPLDTGYMVGMEVTDNLVMQNSITKIVNDQKQGTQDPEIIYMPMTMLSTLKIISKKTFRLMKNVVEDNFKITLLENVDDANNMISVENSQNTSDNSNLPGTLNLEEKAPSINLDQVSPLNMIEETIESDVLSVNENNSQSEVSDSEITLMNESNASDDVSSQNDVIIDYRASFFEEQEKNKNLQLKIDELTAKMEEIKKIIE